MERVSCEQLCAIFLNGFFYGVPAVAQWDGQRLCSAPGAIPSRHGGLRDLVLQQLQYRAHCSSDSITGPGTPYAVGCPPSKKNLLLRMEQSGAALHPQTTQPTLPPPPPIRQPGHSICTWSLSQEDPRLCIPSPSTTQPLTPSWYVQITL